MPRGSIFAWTAAWGLSLLPALPAGAQAPNPVGGEFEVNSYTRGSQNFASVSADQDGNFVVVWRSEYSFGTDRSGYSIHGRRFASNGNAQGLQFQINSYTTSHQVGPSVAADSDGDFIVVWYSDGSSGTDTSQSSIQGQRYDSSGSKQGFQFQVNTYTTGNQGNPSVAADSDGDFVVVWESDGSFGIDTSTWSVQGQRYASDGSTQGGEFQVNTYTTSFQSDAAVTADADGDFVVVWDSNG